MRKWLTILLIMVAFCSHAQWTNDTAANTLVADSNSGDMKSASTSDGKTYVVFWRPVATPENYELRMQVLDANGNKLLGNDGVLVSNSIPMSTFTVLWNIVIDSDDNIFIGVTGTGGGDPAIVFKLDSSGNHLWDSNGVQVGSGNVVTILPLSSDEVIVTWYPGGQSLMQKYTSTGSPIWSAPQSIVNASSSTVPAAMFELSGGEYIVVFHAILSGISTNLYAQRYDLDGLPQWSVNTQISNQTTVFNRYYSYVQDNDDIYIGYFGSSGVRFDSFLQRLNADGTLPWGINGSDFDTNQTDYEMGTEIAYEAGSEDIWAVCTYTNSTQSDRGEFVQKFNKNSGARLFTDNAKVIFPIGSDKVHSGRLRLQNSSPLLLIKDGFDNGASPVSLNILSLDLNGDFVWPEEIRPIATFPANKSDIHFNNPFNDQAVAVFVEDKGSGEKIYAQNYEEIILEVSDLDNNRISYLNPIEDELSLKVDIGIKKITIFNSLGQLICDSNYGLAHEIIIPTATWNTGVYYINISFENDLDRTIKIMKD